MAFNGGKAVWATGEFFTAIPRVATVPDWQQGLETASREFFFSPVSVSFEKKKQKLAARDGSYRHRVDVTTRVLVVFSLPRLKIH